MLLLLLLRIIIIWHVPKPVAVGRARRDGDEKRWTNNDRNREAKQRARRQSGDYRERVQTKMLQVFIFS